MGHERIGFLPHTRQWQAITDQLTQFTSGDTTITQIINGTLDATKRAYEKMPYDESVIKALSFIATLSFSAKQEDQIGFLNNNGYAIGSQISLFSLMASAKEMLNK